MIRPRNRIRRDRQTSMPDTMGFGYVPTFAHPFYPTDLILTDYVANESSTIKLLPTFFGFCALVLITTYLVARAYNPKRSRTELACVAWFLFSESDGSPSQSPEIFIPSHSGHDPSLL